MARRQLPRDCETTRQRDCETTGQRDHGTTIRRDHGTTRPRDHGTTRPRKHKKNAGIARNIPSSRSPVVPSSRKKHRRSQAFPGILRRSQSCVAVRYRAWLISEFREFNEFRDVRAMPATNQVSDVLPLNRAARSRASLNSLISLNSLLTARYHDAPKRDCLASEWCSSVADKEIGLDG